jgi:hypothetical protein
MIVNITTTTKIEFIYNFYYIKLKNLYTKAMLLSLVILNKHVTMGRDIYITMRLNVFLREHGWTVKKYQFSI